jgi:hypothetical protein
MSLYGSQGPGAKQSITSVNLVPTRLTLTGTFFKNPLYNEPSMNHVHVYTKWLKSQLSSKNNVYFGIRVFLLYVVTKFTFVQIIFQFQFTTVTLTFILFKYFVGIRPAEFALMTRFSLFIFHISVGLLHSTNFGKF